jgi:WD40 repeat protein
MASDEDVKVEDEQAMKSMAPVVRESQAFEAAKKEREQRDNHARELAQTMMATMKEDSARAPAIAPTMAEAGTAPGAHAAQSGGSGAKVAIVVLVLLLLGGGGAAGWYFTMGPGAQQPANNRTTIAGTDSGNTDGDPVPVNAGGGDNNGGNGGGNGDGDNGGGNNSSDDGGEQPPPEQDDPLVAQALESAGAAITNAQSLSDLDAAGKQLQRAKLEKHKASPRQRTEMEELEGRLARQYAYLAATEGFDELRQALEAFESSRATETQTAINHLNAAITARDNLAKLEIPPEVEAIVVTERDALIGRVNDTLAEYWEELDSQARRLEERLQYEEAAAILGDMEKVRAAPEKLADVSHRRRVVRVRGIHKVVRDALAIPDFKGAIEQLEKAEDISVPDELQADHAKVVASVGIAIEEKLAGYLKAAIEAADRAEFEEALNERDAALEMPGRNSEQTSRIADATVYIELSEMINAAERATTEERFNDARAKLDAAGDKIAASADRQLPQSLVLRYNNADVAFTAALSERFEALMKSAKESVDALDFGQASEDLADAGSLPLDADQKRRLEAFKIENEKALGDYVSTLINDAEKALDDGDFEAASEKLQLVKSLRVPDDQTERLAEVEQRFGSEATRLHAEFLDKAHTALEEGNYAAARDSLDAAAKIPVTGTAADEREELEKGYAQRLRDEVSGHIEAADKLLDEGKFSEARTRLDEAARLPLDEELRRPVRRKLEQWAEKLEIKLNQLLQAAADARDAEMFTNADALLKEAHELPLEPDQKIRASKAEDELKAAVAAYKEGLFKKLEDAVESAAEKEGKRIIAKLRGMALGPAEQIRVSRLETALTGESDSDRYERLPRHLRTGWQDKVCRTEQLIDIGEQISSLAVSADGKFGAAGTRSGRVHFFKLKRGIRLGSSKGGTRPITAVAISDDGTFAASGNDDGNVVLFTLSGDTVQATDLGTVSDDAFGLAFSANNNVLYVAARDGTITRFNPVTKGRLGGPVNSGLKRAQCMALSPNGSLLAIGGPDSKVAVFDADRMVIKETLEGSGGELIHSVAFSADGSRLIAGSIGDDVAVWDTRRLSKKPSQQFKGLSEWVRGVGFSPDGRRCAAFDSEKRLMVWDTGSGIPHRQIEYNDRFKGEKRFLPSAGVIGPDGTILIGTREGELIHLSLKDAG